MRWDWKGAQRFVERKNMVQFVFRFIANQSNVPRVCNFNFRRSLYFDIMFATSLSEQIQSIVTLSKDSPDENSNHAEFGEQNRL